MYATERQQRIAGIVTDEGRASVTALSALFGVAQETIRRDLDQLQADGVLLRVHGGAVPAGRTSAAEPSLAAREATATEAKEHIAAAALDLIPRGLGGAVHIDAGSTAARVARLLAAREDGNASLTLITNSVITASTLSHLTTPAVRVIGGRLRAVTGALVGAGAIDQIAGLRPDVAIIGTNAVNARFGLSTPDEAEAEVKRAAVASARRVIVVADASKLGEESLVRFGGLDDIDALVTDGEPDADLSEALLVADVDLVRA